MTVESQERQRRLIARLDSVVIYVAWVCALGFVGLSCIALIMYGCEQPPDPTDADRAEAHERHVAQEQAWKDCLDALDLERCDLIEARLAERCAGRDANSCLELER